jgi:hypothetical protein
MSSSIRRIAVCTGGGDAPGLNAVIRSVVVAAINRGWECYGIRDGFNGILFPERYPDGGVFRLTKERVRGIAHLGGTILGTTNRGNPLHFPMKMPDGSTRDVDRSGEILEYFAMKELDALVSIGGDGSLTIANALHQKGLRVVGVPKTIDNDLDKTFTTFGFDTAVAFATECLDRLHSTAESHQRVMVVEVMGRYAGWIALHTGIAGNAHAVLIPEIPFDIDKVAAKVVARDVEGIPTPSCWWPRAPSRRTGTARWWRRPRSATPSAWVASANGSGRRSRRAPARTRGWWSSATCCAAAARPPLTGWRPCASEQPPCARWARGSPASWWRSAFRM